MTWTVPLSGISSHATDTPKLEAGQHWITTSHDEVAAITIIRPVDEHHDEWFVHTSTGQPQTMTTKEITSGYRLVG